MKTYHKKGIKNYWLFSKDGSIEKGIDKKLKKLSNKLARVRLKEELKRENKNECEHKYVDGDDKEETHYYSCSLNKAGVDVNCRCERNQEEQSTLEKKRRKV